MCIRNYTYIFLWLLRSINMYRLYRMFHGHGMTWFMDVHGCSRFPNIGIPVGFLYWPMPSHDLGLQQLHWSWQLRSRPAVAAQFRSRTSVVLLSFLNKLGICELWRRAGSVWTLHRLQHDTNTFRKSFEKHIIIYHLSGVVQVQPAAPTHWPSAETVQGLHMFHTRHMACFSASFHQASPYPSVLSLAALWAQTPGNINCQWRQKVDIFILDE